MIVATEKQVHLWRNRTVDELVLKKPFGKPRLLTARIPESDFNKYAAQYYAG